MKPVFSIIARRDGKEFVVDPEELPAPITDRMQAEAFCAQLAKHPHIEAVVLLKSQVARTWKGSSCVTGS
jgi:hypothetical protein